MATKMDSGPSKRKRGSTASRGEVPGNIEVSESAIESEKMLPSANARIADDAVTTTEEKVSDAPDAEPKRIYRKRKLQPAMETGVAPTRKTRQDGPARWEGSSATIRRIQKELVDISTDPPCNCAAWAKDGSIFEWGSCIDGPDDSPYAGGRFFLDIIFPPEYPFKPPKVVFKTKIYHCNIDASGSICLDILKDKWTPALTASKLLLSICSLLTDANPADPLVIAIAKHFKNDRENHDRTARDWTHRFASVKKR